MRAYTLSYVVAYTSISISLRKSNDAYGIKTELNTSSICGIIFFFLVLLFYLIPTLSHINQKYLITFILAELMFLSYFILSIIIPLYYSYAEERLNLEDESMFLTENHINEVSIGVPLTKFNEILYNAKRREKFGEYLETEFAIQHLHF